MGFISFKINAPKKIINSFLNIKLASTFSNFSAKY
jgi:hypothetical protein